MNITRYLLAILIVFLLLSGVFLAQNAVMEEVGSKAAKAAMEQLQFKSGSQLQNAGMNLLKVAGVM